MVKYSHSLDDVFSALSDGTRREMIQRLTTGPKTVSQLAEHYEMSMPAISKHIQVLERVGLVTTRKTGRIRQCVLIAAPLEEAADWIGTYRKFWEQRLDALDKFLADQEEESK